MVPNPLNPVFCDFIVEFSLQITRGVDFTLSTAANNLCRHICPWLSVPVRLGFLGHVSLKSLSNSTSNATANTCRNCPHTCCRTGRDLYVKRIYCKAKRTSKRKWNHRRYAINFKKNHICICVRLYYSNHIISIFVSFTECVYDIVQGWISLRSDGSGSLQKKSSTRQEFFFLCGEPRGGSQ